MILLSLDTNASKKVLNIFTRLTCMCGDPTTKSNMYLWVLHTFVWLLSAIQRKYPQCSYKEDPTVDIHKKNDSKNKTSPNFAHRLL